MNLLADWCDHPQVIRTGWVLVHFAWQGALLACVWGVARQVLRRRSPQVRYVCGCVILAGMALAPWVTWRAMPPTRPAVLEAVTTRAASAAAPCLSSPASVPASSLHVSSWLSLWADRISREADAVMPWLAGGWLIGVTGLSLRLAAGLQRVSRLRRGGAAVTDAWLLDRLEVLRVRIGLSRPVQLLKSAWVEVPTVAGWLRPVILLPCSSLTGLSPQQIELLVAHELAHVRRLDHWVNLAQVLVEIALFYHPAVWWVSRGVREEREHCCDDLAVAVCGDRIAYVEALASMEELRQFEPNLVLGAGGGSLVARVRRLLGLTSDVAGWRRAAGGTLLLVAMVAVALAVAAWLFSPMRYETAALLQAEAYGSDPFKGRSGARKPDSEYMATAMELVRSRTLLETVVQRERLAELWPSETGPGGTVLDDPVERLRSRITVRRIPPSDLIEVVVWAEKPDLAAGIANAVVSGFVELGVLTQQRQTLDTLFFLKHQAAGLERDVGKAEEDMRAYLLQTKTVSFAPEQNGIGQALNAAMVKWAEVQAQANTAARTLEELERHVASGQPASTFPSLATDPQLRQLQLDLVRLETDLQADIQVRNENEPEVKRNRARLEATRAAADRLAQEAVTTLRANARLAKANEETQSGLVRQWETRQMEWTTAKAQYDMLDAKAKSAKALFNRVIDRMREIELIQKDKAADFRVVDQASPPRQPVYPLRRPALALFAWGLLAGLLGLAVLRRQPLPD